MITTTTTTKTITKSILKVAEKHLKANLIESFREIFNDYDLSRADERSYYQADFHCLTDYLEQMDKGSFSSLFKDGYTMMLLAPGDFREVEKFFDENSHNDNELEIHVETAQGNLIVVKHDDISY